MDFRDNRRADQHSDRALPLPFLRQMYMQSLFIRQTLPGQLLLRPRFPPQQRFSPSPACCMTCIGIRLSRADFLLLLIFIPLLLAARYAPLSANPRTFADICGSPGIRPDALVWSAPRRIKRVCGLLDLRPVWSACGRFAASGARVYALAGSAVRAWGVCRPRHYASCSRRLLRTWRQCASRAGAAFAGRLRRNRLLRLRWRCAIAWYTSPR